MVFVKIVYQKNNCDVLPYSNNCNEVRAMAKHDKEVYNKAIDDFTENIRLYYSLKQEMGYVATTYEDLINYIFELSEQLKAGEGKKIYCTPHE